MIMNMYTNFLKKPFKNKEMVFGNGVKNIQAAAYNGAQTVHGLPRYCTKPRTVLIEIVLSGESRYTNMYKNNLKSVKP